MPDLVRALKRVDLPTLGRPTMPHLRLMDFSFNINALSGTTQPWWKCPIRIEAYSVFWGRCDTGILLKQRFAPVVSRESAAIVMTGECLA